MITPARAIRFAAAVALAIAVAANAAEYRIVPTATDVLAGQVYTIGVAAETLAGDNLVGVGHFSFAIDLTLTGTAGALGPDIGDIVINTSLWDDVQSNQLGHALGNQWLGCGGVTEDVFAPNFGSTIGDVIPLFTFDLTVPASAELGQTIVITPTEGFLQNLTVNDYFDPVSPQAFQAATLTVVPEPTGLILLCASAIGFTRRR